MNFIEKDTQTVALVEDEPSHALLISYNLELRGIKVSLFESGEQFLNSKQDPFDLIITNVNHFDVGGLQLYSEIRNKGIETPILFVTTNPSINNYLCSDKALELLIKPFSIKELVVKVEHLLNKDLKKTESERLFNEQKA
ncbi:hypothetical protein BKP37_10185 [Anaerobacillus alkalilacustris]|uniref:Response regulatory domain-containing protein n=1 Tax=Anaerobacillus alkalilacustris TaxID=393763 RepID=A0A1S2LPP5_9BACI|nr:response regulator [Anaerobacillus alkalilacustris]OIJ13637.1 hypothetical protein BKP37_10185 [Anaerobacillus alkalilacustris]